MRIERGVTYAAGSKCSLTTYSGLSDFYTSLEAATNRDRYTRGYSAPTSWAGGSRADCIRLAKTGDESYARRSSRWLDAFGNMALETYGVSVEHNRQIGALDVGAWMAGVPDCIYGPVVTKHERAPIKVYMDMWILVSILPDTIMRRGCAALALVQALSVYRPVSLEIVLANRHAPSGTDSVQRITAPTSPMDLGRSSWMCAAPVFIRNGLMPMLHEISQSDRPCSIPALSAGPAWQSTQLGKWLAEQDGLGDQDYVFLPMMMNSGPFGSDANAIEWVKTQVEKHK